MKLFGKELTPKFWKYFVVAVVAIIFCIVAIVKHWTAAAIIAGAVALLAIVGTVNEYNSIDVALPESNMPYTKVNNVFGVDRVHSGGTLQVILKPSWTDSVMTCIIPENVMFSVKIDTVQVE